MIKILYTFIVLTLLQGCSTLIGNVKPVDQKSDHYSILDLTQGSSDWKKIDTNEAETESSDETDVSFQSVKSAAIISLNSICRSGKKISNNLELISRELLLGITSVTAREEKKMTISNSPALQTTIEGQLSGEKTKIRVVVLTHESCVFDLMYVTRPDRFEIHEADFARFISSLQLR